MAKRSTSKKPTLIPKPKEPVPKFPLRFRWYAGDWIALFDEQVQLLKDDIARARADDKFIVYLSCPISSRGGGYHGTNVEIAKHTQQLLMRRWGERVWILNPALYQMESKSGRGLIQVHAERLWGRNATSRLKALEGFPPGGGDYMRMWTRVLVEDTDVVAGNRRKHVHLGRMFDAYYFLGPKDVHSFFDDVGTSDITGNIEQYFARKSEIDPEFRDHYSSSDIDWGVGKLSAKQVRLREEWEQKRKDFVRFYSLRASANFSKGCHDEWNIFVEVNKLRFKHLGDIGQLLAGYFDQAQVEPGSSITAVSAGYAL